MKKELTPLDALNYMICNERFAEPTDEEEAGERERCIRVVRDALKRLEKHESPVNKKDLMSVAKRLTVLEIIKDSLEDTSIIAWKHYVVDYENNLKTVYYCLGNPITKEKYELLKEVLTK